jgi:hypothetical protein
VDVGVGQGGELVQEVVQLMHHRRHLHGRGAKSTYSAWLILYEHHVT